MATQYSIVSIDDDRVDSEHLRRTLEAIPEWSTEFRSYTDPMVGLTEVIRRPPDVLFLDLLMKPQSGLELLRQARSLGYDRPVICLTGLEKTEAVVECLRAGAADYLPKESISPAVLERSIDRAICEWQIEEARSGHVRDLEEAHGELKRSHRRTREFYRELSRELSRPLTAVHRLTSLLQEELPEGFEQGSGSYVQLIREGVDDVVHALEDLGDLTACESGRMALRRESVSPGWILRRVVAAHLPTARRERVALNLFAERALPEVPADRVRLERTLSNLLGMAVRYTPCGNEVNLRGRRSLDGEHLEFLVEVTGRNPHLERLVDALPADENAPVEDPELGPSLFFCTEVASLHGGRLDGEISGAGAGRFRLLLPLSSPKGRGASRGSTAPEQETTELSLPGAPS